MIWFAVGLACALPLAMLWVTYLDRRTVAVLTAKALLVQARTAELLQIRRLEEEREARAVRASRTQRQPVGFRPS